MASCRVNFTSYRLLTLRALVERRSARQPVASRPLPSWYAPGFFLTSATLAPAICTAADPPPATIFAISFTIHVNRVCLVCRAVHILLETSRIFCRLLPVAATGTNDLKCSVVFTSAVPNILHYKSNVSFDTVLCTAMQSVPRWLEVSTCRPPNLAKTES